MSGDASPNRWPMRRHSAAHRDGRGDRIAGRPAAAHDRRCEAARHHPSAGSAERSDRTRFFSLVSRPKAKRPFPNPCQRAISTERAFHEFGVRVEKAGEAIRVTGGQPLKARELVVLGDVSSAAFWIALAAGTPRRDRDRGGGPESDPHRHARDRLVAQARRSRSRSTTRTLVSRSGESA